MWVYKARRYPFRASGRASSGICSLARRRTLQVGMFASVSAGSGVAVRALRHCNCNLHVWPQSRARAAAAELP